MHLPFASFTFDMVTSPEVIVSVLNQVSFLLAAAATGLCFNAYLVDRAVFEGLGRVRSELFDGWDALIASVLSGFFLVLVLRASNAGETGSDATPGAAEIITGMVGVAVIFFLLITGILAVLFVRQISWRDTFGLTRLGPLAILGKAVFLLLLAYPLITISAVVSEILLAAGGNHDDSNQELVNFFIRSHSDTAKWVVAVSAVLIAPMQEEFLFRGYIYGVARRYGGVLTGVLFNSTLFALIHMHLPSFVPLFALAVCLSLAYEWTGSLWVPMCMHAMFNSVTVINLMFGRDH